MGGVQLESLQITDFIAILVLFATIVTAIAAAAIVPKRWIRITLLVPLTLIALFSIFLLVLSLSRKAAVKKNEQQSEPPPATPQAAHVKEADSKPGILETGADSSAKPPNSGALQETPRKQEILTPLEIGKNSRLPEVLAQPHILIREISYREQNRLPSKGSRSPRIQITKESESYYEPQISSASPTSANPGFTEGIVVSTEPVMECDPSPPRPMRTLRLPSVPASMLAYMSGKDLALTVRVGVKGDVTITDLGPSAIPAFFQQRAIDAVNSVRWAPARDNRCDAVLRYIVIDFRWQF